MKVGYQVGVYPAKSESWIRLEVDGLRAAGHDVVISSLGAPRNLSDCAFVVCHFATVAGYANGHGRPFVLVPHANDIWPTDGAYLKRAILEHENLRAVGFISSYHRQRYLAWGVPGRMLVDWPCAVDTELFTRPVGRPLGDLVIAGGRDVPKKGLDVAVAAWPGVVLFGGAVRFPNNRGWLSPTQLRDLMLDAWCLLAPCQVDPKTRDMDGKPIAVLEAASLGLRVICGVALAGLPDLAGLVTFTDGTVEGLCKAIEAEPHVLNMDGMRYVREKHAVGVVVDNVLAVGKGIA